MRSAPAVGAGNALLNGHVLGPVGGAVELAGAEVAVDAGAGFVAPLGLVEGGAAELVVPDHVPGLGVGGQAQAEAG